VPLHSSIVAAVALGAICACTPISSLDVNRAALTDANRRYDAALLSGDAAALQALYADDFQYFGPGNVVRDFRQSGFDRRKQQQRRNSHLRRHGGVNRTICRKSKRLRTGVFVY
jgi:hypothetical protein